jgi:hypothetical protein
MRRGLESGNECCAAEIALQAANIFGGDDNNLIASVDRDVLRPFRVHAPHKLAEPGFCILQKPAAGPGIARPPARFESLRGLRFRQSGHSELD